ncbi:MAG: ABC transporter permease [Candidatus Sumerlaeaceae bacterium]|nr:ABC transporter permease [Candidatus Sumerlaeaceae bacterium]
MRLLPLEYATRNLGRNPVRTLLTSLGAAVVVFMVILMGAFVETLGSTFRRTGDPANVIVLGLGSEDFLEQSEIAASVPGILAASVPGIASHHGIPLVSPEVHHAAAITLPHESVRPGSDLRRGLIRGVTPTAFLVHRQVFLDEGRAPGPGQVIAGRLAETKLGLPAGSLHPGARIIFEGREWEVAGRFSAPGTVYEAEIWAPLEEVKIAVKRKTISCAIARVESSDVLTDIEIFTKSRLDLELAAVSETRHYAKLAAFVRPVQVMGWAMAALVAAGGLFGGLNTMIAAISGRVRELACLETLGFSRTAIVISLMQEAILQAGSGALLAAAGATMFLAGTTVRFTMGAMALDVGPVALAAGVAAALTLAVAGSLVPAVRLVRMPLVELLRS